MTDSPVALVTGASRGLGRALALEAARRGAHVVALARTVGALEELDDAIRAAGGAATLTPLDLTDAPALERLAQAIGSRWGRLDLWLHAACHAPPLSPAPHVAAKDSDRTFAVNLRATEGLIRALDPLLRAAPAGRAALMDDRREGEAYFGLYAASKAGARALWRAWGLETRRSAFRAPLVLPPPMPTALRARFYPGEDRAGLTRPETVAPLILDALAGEPPAEIDLRQIGRPHAEA